MRMPFAINDRLFARWYPYVMGRSEDAGMRETRRALIGRAVGRTLEIGAGHGANLPHYPPSVTELVVTEPSPFMLEHLHTLLESEPPPVGSWCVVRTGAERLPFDDDSFDTVVGAFVHCTISDPARALREIARVLRPGGRYLFVEHVRSDTAVLGRLQHVLEYPHRVVAAGCHPNRRTEQLLAESPLRIADLVHEPMPRSSPTVRPTIRGSAVADD